MSYDPLLTIRQSELEKIVKVIDSDDGLDEIRSLAVMILGHDPNPKTKEYTVTLSLPTTATSVQDALDKVIKLIGSKDPAGWVYDVTDESGTTYYDEYLGRE